MGKRMSTLANERTILDSLKAGPKTMQALADGTGINYYSVRRIIDDLLKRRIVKVEGTIDRAMLYCYIGGEGTSDYIPRVTDIINKVSVKSVLLTDSIGREDSMRSVVAAKQLPKFVVELLLLAQQAETGAVLGDKLDRLRDEIQRNYLYMQNAANMYEQILQEPRYWDSKHLAKMVHDPDYNYAVLQDAWDRISED